MHLYMRKQLYLMLAILFFCVVLNKGLLTLIWLRNTVLQKDEQITSYFES